MTKEEVDKRATELALEHWAYIEELLDAHRVDIDAQSVAEFHYLEAFKHGYKHCWEDFNYQIPGQIVEYKK